MQTIRDLLNRIRWDPEYAKGNFEIGYFDRIKNCIIRLPFNQLYFNAENHFTFQFMDEDGTEHSVPLHRIRSVYKNGELIWHRDKPPGA